MPVDGRIQLGVTRGLGRRSSGVQARFRRLCLSAAPGLGFGEISRPSLLGMLTLSDPPVLKPLPLVGGAGPELATDSRVKTKSGLAMIKSVSSFLTRTTSDLCVFNVLRYFKNRLV